MAFLEGIAGYVKRKDGKKCRHKTESRQRYSLNGQMTDLGLTAESAEGVKRILACGSIVSGYALCALCVLCG